MQVSSLKTVMAAVASIAMLLPLAACGTTDDDSGIASYNVSTVAKDETIAALLPDDVTKDGKLTIGTNPSYAPAEFLAADGKTQIGYDMDLAHALGNIFGLKTEIISANFDTIIPAIGTKYDLGIAAFTVTPERLEAVDFVSYFTAGMAYAVRAGNPDHVNVDNLCGRKVAVETGTVEKHRSTKQLINAKQVMHHVSKSSHSSSKPTVLLQRLAAKRMYFLLTHRSLVTQSRKPTVNSNNSVTISTKYPTRLLCAKAMPTLPKRCDVPCKNLWMTARI